MYVSQEKNLRECPTLNDADGTHARMFFSEAVASHYIRQILQVGKRKREQTKKRWKICIFLLPLFNRKLVKICLADFFRKGGGGTLQIQHVFPTKKSVRGGGVKVSFHKLMFI